MSIALYPYAPYSVFVGGGGTLLLENEIEQADFCAVTFTLQQGSFSPQPTAGTLTFHITSWAATGKKKRQHITVTALQLNQSTTVVHDSAIVRIECQVTSDFKEDIGIPAQITLQSLVQSNGHEQTTPATDCCQAKKCSTNKQKTKVYKIQSESQCVCARCVAKIISKQPCPLISLVTTSAVLSSTITFDGTGTNVMFLNPCVSTCAAMLPLLRLATLTQGAVVASAPVLMLSATRFRVQLPNTLFVTSAPATLVITPANPSCPAISFVVTLTPPV